MTAALPRPAPLSERIARDVTDMLPDLVSFLFNAALGGVWIASLGIAALAHGGA